MWLFSLIFVNTIILSFQYTPIVLWHGMGDSCCNPLSLGKFSKILKNQLADVYVKSLRFGNNMLEDIESGYFMNVNKQIELACAMIQEDPILKDGYNAIGMSQGGQFLRALAQRCPEPRMKNLISMGGQHQGVYGLPHCFYPTKKWCDYVRKVLNKAAYENWVQKSLVQAQYWHDPLDEDLYQRGSLFMAEINNERVINTRYINNLQKLDNFVMVRFNNDTMVQPIASEWFGFYKSGQGIEIEDLVESRLYIEDRLGLKQMNEDGKLHFISLDGDHLEFGQDWFNTTITQQFLNN